MIEDKDSFTTTVEYYGKFTNGNSRTLNLPVLLQKSTNTHNSIAPANGRCRQII